MSATPRAAVVFERASGIVRVPAEMARTPEAILRGLAGRDHVPDDTGMVLLWPAPGRLRVWMKDARVPLDAVFVGVFGRIVGIERDLQPADLTLRGPAATAAYVVELPAGHADRYGLAVGQAVRIEGEAPPPRPTRTVAIVDPMRVGTSLARELAVRGATVLAVHGSPTTDRARTDAAAFERVFVHEGDAAALAAALRPYGVDAVVAATETGVRVADALGHLLSARGNDYASREARRDKYEMIEAAARAGLLVARQIRSSSVEEVVAWRAAEGLDEVVVKPLDSAGGDGVAICATDAEIADAMRRIVGKKHRLGSVAGAVVAQERLVGTEYIVNAASLGSEHRFADAWRYLKGPLHGSPVMYDTNALVDPGDPLYDALIAYTARVLDALGVRIGPSHTELMVTSRGPALVECGARFDGITAPEAWRACIGRSAVELAAEALADPAAFLARSRKPEALIQHARTVYLRVAETGVVASVPARESLPRLASYRALLLNATEGARVRPSNDFFSAGGVALLTHADAAVVEADRDEIRRLEAAGSLLRITAAPAPDAELLREFAQRVDVHQSPGFQRLMAALGWARVDVGGVGYARQFPDGRFVKILRPARLDADAVRRLCVPGTRVVIEPGLRVTLPDGFVAADRSWAYDVTLIRRLALPVDEPEPDVVTVPFPGDPDLRAAAMELRSRSRGGHGAALLSRAPDAFAGSGWLHLLSDGPRTLGAAWVVLQDRVATCLDLHVDPEADAVDVRAGLLRAAVREATLRGADLFDLGGGTDPDAAEEGWCEVRYPPGVRPA